MESIEFYGIHGRRLGGESNREISLAPVCVIPSLGLWSSISDSVGRGARALLACLLAWSARLVRSNLTRPL